MRYLVSILIMLGMVLTLNISTAAPYQGCQRKLANLEKQLGYAKQYGNTNRIRGLERAIANVKTYCGGGMNMDSSTGKEYFEGEKRLEKSEEILEKLADAQKDLAKAEYKYEKAKYKDDFEDQLEAEYKMKEARMRIQMYEEYLKTLK
ncbi:DUF1090 family protein [Ignatzschineria sp. LJL83]